MSAPLPSSPFLWGVATSSDQHEGGINGESEPQNNWAWAERDGKVETIGPAARFWEKAEGDFALCKDLGLNAFRLSLSWPRIQPLKELPETPVPFRKLGKVTPPPFDTAALDRYAEILASARKNGLEPVVTLHHFTHPAWLGEDAWLNRRTVDFYLAYVETVVRHLLPVLIDRHQVAPPRYLITINEPNMLSVCHYLFGLFPSGPSWGLHPAYSALAHMLEAHIKARRLIKRLYAELAPRAAAPLVTFNNYCTDLFWTDQAWVHLMFAPSRGVPKNEIFPHLWKEARAFDRSFSEARLPIQPPLRNFIGQGLKKFHHFLAWAGSIHSVWEPLIETLYDDAAAFPGDPPIDYLAIDYYDPFIAHFLRTPHWADDVSLQHRRPHEHLLNSITSKWWDWHLLPEGLAFYVKTLRPFNLPIMIAENGMATRQAPPIEGHPQPKVGRRDNLLRSDYIRRHVGMVNQLRREGHPLIGYLHWSLVDNYEWGTYAPRFGLFNAERTPAGVEYDDNAASTYAEMIAISRLPSNLAKIPPTSLS
ncbi:6-phospho-beta-galactosidase [Verrucomicrobium sp. GAS474]|uniref:family 1 glycosylhydrolase n=1 Tax=Verrucomicrobium sp. GAS474 TaxID=1882831 RepID=UPI00087DCB05|nr:family 1 glycosylhydrolase [Verrucomicrobium sp. GAS474]SDU20365.1 6-phospho-beta-galactosidase [Verrucomicrobium sp. GAS474]